MPKIKRKKLLYDRTKVEPFLEAKLPAELAWWQLASTYFSTETVEPVKVHPQLVQLKYNPCNIFLKSGLTPDPWQQKMLLSQHPRRLVLAARQSGKSKVCAAIALATALLKKSLVLILSRTKSQARELFLDKLMPLYWPWRDVVPSVGDPCVFSLSLENGSRIIALPNHADGIVGYSDVSLLLIDEAARVPDELYEAVMPMLGISKGTLIASSTPKGKRGWFYKAAIKAEKGEEDWEHVKVHADMCPRLSPEVLMEYLKKHGERMYRQEFACAFNDLIGSVFSDEDIQETLVDAPDEPLFVEPPEEDDDEEEDWGPLFVDGGK